MAAWYSWCNDTSTTTSVTTTWTEWNNSTSTTGTATGTGYVWYTWTSSDSTATSYRRIVPPQETEEQRAEREARAAEAARRREKEECERLEAERKAKRLLERNLNSRQRASMKKRSFFYLNTTSGRRYRIDTDRIHGNIYEVDEIGRKLRSLCVQPSGVPIHDAILAQKLHLEHNEDHIRERANFRECAAG